MGKNPTNTEVTVIVQVIERLTLWKGMSKRLNLDLKTLFLLFLSNFMGSLLGQRDKNRHLSLGEV